MAAGTNSSELALCASAVHVSATYLPMHVASVASHGKGMANGQEGREGSRGGGGHGRRCKEAAGNRQNGKQSSRQVRARGTSSHQQAL